MSTVIVTDKKYVVDPLFQWDQGQVLEIRGLSLAKAPEIHFDNGCLSGCVVKQATMDNAGIIYVNIPNLILQKPHKITAYVCDCGEEVFRSLYAFEIPVKPRKKPEFYEVVDEYEIYSIEALKAEVEIELQKILDSYNLVDTSVENAKTSEENAKVSENNAKASENSAKEYENSAKLTEERAREVFESIPEDYSTISNDLYELAIKETASGEEIHVNDSSNLKLREFALYGKAKQNTTSGKNLVSDDWEQGLLSVDNGTSISSNSYWIHTNKYVEVDSTKQYTISGDTTSSATIYFYDENKSFLTTLQPLRYAGTPSNTINIPEKTKYVRFGYNYSGATETITPEQMGVLHWLQLEEGEVATEYEPYTGGISSPNPQYPQPIEVSGASGSVAVKSCGKNLIDYYPKTTISNNGVTANLNDDGTWVLNGIGGTGGSTIGIVSISTNNDLFNSIKGKNVTINGCPQNGSDTTFFIQLWGRIDSSTSVSARDYGNGANIIFPKVVTNWNVAIMVREGVVVNNLVFKPMIRYSEIADDTYEPYKETLATIPTENGLASVNDVRDVIVKYADGSGERIQNVWVEDVTSVSAMDSSNKLGKLVISKRVINNTSFADNNFVLCDRGILKNLVEARNGVDGISHYGQAIYFRNANIEQSVNGYNAWIAENPLKVAYVLETPIVTPLTAEEIAEIEKLHTFYPITNISNDFDCGMSVTYYCDSKNYIGNQLAIMKQEQEEAMMNMLLLMPTEVQAMMIENDTNDLLKESEI